MKKKTKIILAFGLIFAATAMLLFTFAVPSNPGMPIETQSDEAEVPALYGYNSVENGTAILGEAINSEGTIGVKGIGNFGVLGQGQMIGVEGRSQHVSGTGVSGIAPDGNGVYGESSTGTGVWGNSKRVEGPAKGVWGTAKSSNSSGKGVQGEGFFAVYGQCTNPKGYAGYFDGGKGLRIPVLAGDPVNPVEEGTIWVNRNQQVMKIRMGGRNYSLRAD